MKIPFLKNFRRGFATNSSSSHSFVYLKEDSPNAHDEYMDIPEDFGWSDFRLSSIKEKLFYVLVGRIGTGGWTPPSETDITEAYEEHGEDFPELSRDDFAEALSNNIDHQSRGTIGADLARDPRVIVFGGNDNGGDSAERARAIREGVVDWELTTPEYDDFENIPKSDVKARELLMKQYPYLANNDD